MFAEVRAQKCVCVCVYVGVRLHRCVREVCVCALITGKGVCFNAAGTKLRVAKPSIMATPVRKQVCACALCMWLCVSVDVGCFTSLKIKGLSCIGRF